VAIRTIIFRTAAWTLGSFVLAGQSLAYEIDYAADRPSELLACDAQLFRGEAAASARCYAGLLAANDDLRIKAESAWALSNYVSANQYFQEAFDVYPEDPLLRARWGELFAVTHKPREAQRLFEEALALDPS
jgi:tetratricopeptide (TPR) repeat protein